MARQLLAIAVLAFLLAVVGCSHRASVTNLPSGRQENRGTPQVGDKAEYSINSAAGFPSAKNSTVRVIGSKTYTVVAGRNHGRSVPSYIVRTFDLREDSKQHAGSVSRSRTVVTWFGQDASGNLYILGESLDGVTWDVVSDDRPPVYMPSQLREGHSWGYAARFASGDMESVAMKCVGRERVTTPAGEFEAYKVSITITRLGMSLSGYMWLAEDVPLVFELKAQFSSDGSMKGMPASISQLHTLEKLKLVR